PGLALRVTPAAAEAGESALPLPVAQLPQPFDRGSTVAGLLRPGVAASPVEAPAPQEPAPHAPGSRTPADAAPASAVPTPGHVAAPTGGSETTSTPAVPADRSAAPISEQLAGQMVSHARLVERGRVAEFTIDLHPPALGNVRVHLSASQDGLTARL